MDFRVFARNHFRKAIQENQEISSELRAKLLSGNYPRIETYIDRISVQLRDAQHKRVQQGKKPWDLSQLAWLVQETTKVFICGVEAAAKKLYQTEAARLKAEQEAQAIKEMDATLNGKPEGVFAEMGLTIGDRSTAVPKA